MAASTSHMFWPGPGDEAPYRDTQQERSLTEAPPLTPVAIWVTAVHLLLLVGYLMSGYFIPTPPPQPAMLSMLDPGELTKGDPMGGAMVSPPAGTPSSAPAFSPPSSSTPPPSLPRPPAPTEETFTPPPKSTLDKERDTHTEPEPSPVAPPQPRSHELTPPPEPRPKSKPEPKSESKPEPKPVRKTAAPEPAPEPPKPKIKIDLTQVSRPRTDTASPITTPSLPKTARNHNRTDAAGDGRGDTQTPGLSASDIKKKLGTSMQRAGVDQAPMTGGPSGGGGRGDDFSAYRTLIRDQLFQAWDRPIALAGKKLTTIITIILDREGNITSVTLKQSSGNQQHDQTALDAAHQVRRIKAPLPEGLAPRFDISFFLQD